MKAQAMQRVPLSVVFVVCVVGGLFIIHDWQTAVGILAFLVLAIGALVFAGLVFVGATILAWFG
jgi:hypothetical protein